MAVEDAPKLIPIFYHRYMPDNPTTAGNPVFSVHQTDIIYYGYDLASYFENEFFKEEARHRIGGDFKLDTFQDQPKPIRFWDEIVG